MSARPAKIRNVSSKMEALYQWPSGTSVALLDFAETVLWQQCISEKIALQKQIVTAVEKTLKRELRGIPRRDREIRYCSKDGGMRSLVDEIIECKAWLAVNGEPRRGSFPLKPVDWIVWNLAPFFRKRSGDPIQWRDLVRFLNCISFSGRLAAKRSQGSTPLFVLKLESKRMEAIYKRRPSGTPRDPKIERALNRHIRHRDESPLKVLHATAFKRLKRLIS